MLFAGILLLIGLLMVVIAVCVIAYEAIPAIIIGILCGSVLHYLFKRDRD